MPTERHDQPDANLRHRKKGSRSYPGINIVSAIAAIIPVLALLAIIAVLLSESLPAIKLNGISFFTKFAWRPGGTYSLPIKTDGILHPVGSSFGIWPLLAGTLESSGIALLIAIPVSIGAALAVVKKLPKGLSNGVGFFLEILTGIPSVVYGLWGVMTLGPTLSRDVFPFIANHAPSVFGFNFLKGNVGHGEGLITSGIILAIMVIPIISATTRDLLRQVPVVTEEGGTAIGMTDWETTKKITLPWVSKGVVGACILGLARALGETMAVAMVSGSVLGTIPSNLYSTFTTIAATIVSQLDSALTDGTGFYVKTLAETALVLMLITLLANIAARLLVKRVASAGLPVGRGV